ncbi:MAG: sigma-54-dependent Fis family transcriptional regulator [Verrucomicrobiales bacterium]|nr:sigma-54-dependent Fis family transcriptional regulator [Verrucomicrobiales bacterium]
MPTVSRRNGGGPKAAEGNDVGDLADVKATAAANAEAGGVLAGRSLDADYVFHSPAMQAVERVLRRVAGSEASVFLTGESGTGKEVVAELIHRLSTHATGPLVKVNCAALPRDLVESELFGAVRGAYTGSVENRLGLFTQADGGTLLLDELTEMPVTAQGKLLRVLQDRRFRPLGAHRELQVNCRVIAATNLRPELAIQAQKLRLDLYYRLSIVTIHLPPLRERREDIPLLVQRFIARFSELMGRPVRGLTATALAHLLEHDWPGNVRQLENVLHRAVLLCEGDQVDVADLALPPSPSSSPATSPTDLAGVERDAIIEALRRCEGNKVAAARLLGIARQTLYNKLRDFELDPDTRGWGRPVPAVPAGAGRPP